MAMVGHVELKAQSRSLFSSSNITVPMQLIDSLRSVTYEVIETGVSKGDIVQHNDFSDQTVFARFDPQHIGQAQHDFLKSIHGLMFAESIVNADEALSDIRGKTTYVCINKHEYSDMARRANGTTVDVRRFLSEQVETQRCNGIGLVSLPTGNLGKVTHYYVVSKPIDSKKPSSVETKTVKTFFTPLDSGSTMAIVPDSIQKKANIITGDDDPTTDYRVSIRAAELISEARSREHPEANGGSASSLDKPKQEELFLNDSGEEDYEASAPQTTPNEKVPLENSETPVPVPASAPPPSHNPAYPQQQPCADQVAPIEPPPPYQPPATQPPATQRPPQMSFHANGQQHFIHQTNEFMVSGPSEQPLPCMYSTGSRSGASVGADYYQTEHPALPVRLLYPTTQPNFLPHRNGSLMMQSPMDYPLPPQHSVVPYRTAMQPQQQPQPLCPPMLSVPIAQTTTTQANAGRAPQHLLSNSPQQLVPLGSSTTNQVPMPVQVTTGSQVIIPSLTAAPPASISSHSEHLHPQEQAVTEQRVQTVDISGLTEERGSFPTGDGMLDSLRVLQLESDKIKAQELENEKKDTEIREKWKALLTAENSQRKEVAEEKDKKRIEAEKLLKVRQEKLATRKSKQLTS